MSSEVTYEYELFNFLFFYSIAMLHGEFVELYAEYNLSYMLEHAKEIANM
jgi:hypothetical protein